MRLPAPNSFLAAVVGIASMAGLLACGSDGPEAPDAGPASFSVLLTTTTGPVLIDVHREWSPNGADRFRELVEDGFYDDCRFFRIIPGFIAQFGINGRPATQAMWDGNTIADDPVVTTNSRATIAFAKTSEPNSRTTQLFINYVDNGSLDAQGFSPFGVVRTGMDNVDAINSQYGERPDQGEITSQGNIYLDASFPGLDSITTARIQ